MKTYKLEITIEAPDGAYPESARAEIAGAIEDARDSYELGGCDVTCGELVELSPVGLPEGYKLETDGTGGWWLYPPKDVTIFSAPGEGWLVTDDVMRGRDWENRRDVVEACVEYLIKVGDINA